MILAKNFWPSSKPSSLQHTKLKLTRSIFNVISYLLFTLISIYYQWKLTDLARKIHNAHTTATLSGKQISYMWIPGIEGNELADKAAKLAYLANSSLTSLGFTYQGVKKIIAIDAHDQWENKWAEQTTK